MALWIQKKGPYLKLLYSLGCKCPEQLDSYNEERMKQEQMVRSYRLVKIIYF